MTISNTGIRFICNDIESKLIELRNTPGYVEQKIESLSDLQVFARSKNGNLSILIETSFDRSVTQSKIQKLSTEVFTLSLVQSKNKDKLQIQLNDLEFLSVFAKMCSDIISWNNLQNSHNIKALYTRLKLWNQLFQKGIKKALSGRERQGLFGELVVILELLKKGLLDTDIIPFWVGPNGAPQDIQFKNCAIEIKSPQKKSITISSLEQLFCQENEKLYLWINNIIEDSSGKTLVDIIEMVEQKLTTQQDQFWHKLHQVGYLKEFEHLYKMDKFFLTSVDIYQIEGAFPKLTRQSVPEIILDATYIIEHKKIPSKFKVNQESLIQDLLDRYRKTP